MDTLESRAFSFIEGVSSIDRLVECIVIMLGASSVVMSAIKRMSAIESVH